MLVDNAAGKVGLTMATGYTASVQDGTTTSFREFAIKCARAFGANILMRDDSMDAPIREYEPNTWNKERLEKAREAFYAAEQMTLEEAAMELASERERVAKRRTEAQATSDSQRQRYEAMLAKVREWKPPTEQHERMKQFMIEQLTESIRFDCQDMSDWHTVKAETPEEFKAQVIEKAVQDMEYHTEEWKKEQLSTRERNEWNKALFESLPAK